VRAAAGALLAVLLALNAPGAARAQEGFGTAGQDSTLASPGASDSAQVVGVIPGETTIGTPDSVFVQEPRSPILYQSSYNRDQSNGTWNQSLAYGFHRGPLAVDLNGSSSTLNELFREGFGGRSGEFTGQLNYRPVPRWALTMSGRFDSNSSGSAEQGTRQRQNRIELRSQYSLGPWRGVSFRTLLSTAFEQEHNLSFSQEADTTHRDSTTVDGRTDAVNAQLDWRPAAGLAAVIQGGKSRGNPTTETVTRLIPTAGGGTGGPAPTTITSTTPIDNSNVLGRVTYIRGALLNTSLQVNKVRNVREYFDALYRDPSGSRQEHIDQDVRSGTLHFQTQPARALLFSADGTLSQSFNQYRLRTGSTNRVRTRQLQTGLTYAQVRTRGSLRLEVTRAENDRQRTQNGLSLTRLLTGYAGRQMTRRLWLEGTGTATLTSRQYVYPDSLRRDPEQNLRDDRDQVRSYFNLGAGYAVSSRCSTSVHFSTGRTHTVAIGAQSSGNNFVQTNYQMDAMLRLKATRTLSVQQNYSLSAVYQIYDYVESRNFLSRIKRIDTVVADTLVPHVYASVTHNYLFRDAGSFARPSAGADRLYAPTLETYQQYLTATLGLRSPAGINGFLSQNLGNTRNRTLSTGAETVNNRWTLTFGGDMSRTLSGGTELQVSAKHVGAYTERPPECDGPNPPASCLGFDRAEESYWTVNAAVQKAF
jgi:hypothetical protein